MLIQKYAKSCCHKTNLGNYFDDPTLPTGSLRCACVYIAARRLNYCTKEAALSPRAAKEAELLYKRGGSFSKSG